MKNSRSFFPAFAALTFLLAAFAAPRLCAETYVLTIYETADQLVARADPDRAAAYWQGFADFGHQLQQAGLIRGGSAFEATSVRQVTAAGPRVEGPASNGPTLSGYFVIEAPSLEEALRWAARAPNVAHGGTVSVFACIKSPVMN